MEFKLMKNNLNRYELVLQNEKTCEINLFAHLRVLDLSYKKYIQLLLQYNTELIETGSSYASASFNSESEGEQVVETLNNEIMGEVMMNELLNEPQINISGGHGECYRGFQQFSKAWYSKAALDGRNILDEVCFGFYHPEGGTTGEMNVEWKKINSVWTPRLKAFNDSWGALSQFHDLINAMGEQNDQDLKPDEFCEILRRCGFRDMTKTKYGEH